MDNKLQNVSQIHNHASSSSYRHLKDGDTVRVRVISDKGGGNYEGSVAGVKIKLHSNSKLVPGSSFPASVSVKNGKLSLVQSNLSSGINFNLVNLSEIELVFEENATQNISPKLLNLLQVLGLPADSFGLHVMKTIRQLNIAFDNPVIRKILQKSGRNQLNKKSRADIMLLISQKNLSSLSDDEIDMLASLLDGNCGEENSGYKNKDDNLHPFSFDAAVFAELKSIIKEYFSNLFNNPAGIVENAIQNDGKTLPDHPESIELKTNSSSLALLNQTFSGPSTGALGNWICIPFEVVSKKNDTASEGLGIVRFYITQDEKLKYVCLKCVSKQKKFAFSIKFDRNKCTDIKINVSAVNNDENSENDMLNITSSSEIDRHIKSFQKIFSTKNENSRKNYITESLQDVNIEWKESSFFEGLFCDDDKLLFLDGLV